MRWDHELNEGIIAAKFGSLCMAATIYTYIKRINFWTNEEKSTFYPTPTGSNNAWKFAATVDTSSCNSIWTRQRSLAAVSLSLARVNQKSKKPSSVVVTTRRQNGGFLDSGPLRQITAKTIQYWIGNVGIYGILVLCSLRLFGAAVFDCLLERRTIKDNRDYYFWNSYFNYHGICRYTSTFPSNFLKLQR